MNDTVWKWFRDKVWTCKLTVGPLSHLLSPLPPFLWLTHSHPARCHQPAELGSIAWAALEEQRLDISLILSPSRVQSKVRWWFTSSEASCLCSLHSSFLQTDQNGVELSWFLLKSNIKTNSNESINWAFSPLCFNGPNRDFQCCSLYFQPHGVCYSPNGPFCCDHSRQWEVNLKRTQTQYPHAFILHPGASHPLLYNGLMSLCGRWPTPSQISPLVLDFRLLWHF